jgi:L-rhamnose mutarotase
MKRYAWTWTIKEEMLDEYVRLHKNPPRDIVEAHEKAGFRNYSIFQNGRQFFYVFECTDIDYARDYCAKDESCIRWNEVAMTMIEGDFGDRVESNINYLEEIWHVE